MNHREENIPRHIAIIMDGNGRWARSRGLDRAEGHAVGVERLRDAIRACVQMGVRYLTVYTFSTENWRRPRAEVEAIMELFCRSVEAEGPELMQQGVHVVAIGDREGLPRKVGEAIARIEESTAGGDRLTLALAFNYGARAEWLHAVRQIAREAAEGRIDPDEVDAAQIERWLYTAALPDPDLLIRTGGERRLSNFLLWQAAYTELYFTEVLWPDFTAEHLRRAVADYGNRERRFGTIKSQDE